MLSKKLLRKNQYKILHFWDVRGGLGGRFKLLVDALGESGCHVSVLRTLKDAFFDLILRRNLWIGEPSIVIFTSLLAPLVILMKMLSPRLRIVYMVRGDEINEALHKNRFLRAYVAYFFQFILALFHTKFVFVSWDLRELFCRRFGGRYPKIVLPNTVGVEPPPTRRFDGTVTVVGDFGTVKNIEWVLERLEGTEFKVRIYGNKTLPDRWMQPWVTSFGVVESLQERLLGSSLLVITSQSEGYPNIINEALLSGCPVIVHDAFPFEFFPMSSRWKFSIKDDSFVDYLREIQQMSNWSYDSDNNDIRQLIASDWRSLLSDVL